MANGRFGKTMSSPQTHAALWVPLTARPTTGIVLAARVSRVQPAQLLGAYAPGHYTFQ
jgi:uncharacterized membrane protein